MTQMGIRVEQQPRAPRMASDHQKLEEARKQASLETLGGSWSG